MEPKLQAQAVSSSRWGYVAVAVILLLFLGLIYAWSNFVGPLEAEFGWTRDETQLAFTICMSLFCIGGFVSGIVSRRFSPRVTMFLCAASVLAGFVATSRVNTLPGLYLSYGCLVGFGVGLAYNALISTVVKWFPERPGFISGLMLMGFGLGGMVLGTASTTVMAAIGWRRTFFLLGLVFAALTLIGSLFVRLPPPGMQFPAPATRQKAREEGLELRSVEMVRRPAFWMLFLWAVLLSAAGLSLISNASPLAQDMGLSAGTAALLTGVVSVFNGSGRVIVGLLIDRVGRRFSMFLVSGAFVVSFLIVAGALLTRSVPVLVAGFVCGGFAYGGIMPTNSTVIGSFYGQKYYAMNFSIINLCLLIASVLSQFIAGNLQMLTGGFLATALVATGFGVVGALLCAAIRRP